MKSWVVAASLLAAVFFVPVANAADVGDDRDNSYSDPRYRGPPPAYNDRDDDYDDDGPPVRRKYSGPMRGEVCARSEQVRERLTGMGWRDFHAGQPQNDDLVTLRARRPSGRLFELTLHRCSGEIVEARPLEPRPFGPYAYNNRVPDNYYGRPQYGDRWRDDTYAYRDWRWWPRRY